MRLHCGKVPENAEFLPDRDGWRPIREPSPWIAQLLALPIGFAIATGLAALWAHADITIPFDVSGFSLIAWIIGIVLVHEVVHAAFHPGSGASPDTVLGFWPSRLVFFAHYDGVLSRGRFAAILLGPFLVLSLVPLIGALAGRAPFHLAFVSVFNSLLSCVDILGAFLLMVMVPKNARVRNKGWRTYYRVDEERAEGDAAGGG